MFVDTTIYGYTADGAAYHPGCEPEGLDASTDPDVRPLYSWDLDEWSDGLSCDGCTDWIVEPDAPEEPECPDEAESDIEVVELRNREVLPDPLWRWER